jgi:hypothetical protein
MILYTVKWYALGYNFGTNTESCTNLRLIQLLGDCNVRVISAEMQ